MQPRSTRLNSSNRRTFVQAVLQDLLGDQPTDKAFMDRWTPQIYGIVYGPYTELMDQLPDWFFVEEKDLSVTIDNETVRFRFTKPVKRINENHGYWGSAGKLPSLPDDHPATKEWKQYKLDLKNFNIKHRELDTKFSELVESCNTSGQLYKAWPEAEKYAHCFPYKAPNRHQGPSVSKEEIDLATKVANIKMSLTEEN